MPDPLGIVLALASASVYAAYVLSDRHAPGLDPVAFAAPLVAGAATAFLVFGSARGEARRDRQRHRARAVVVRAIVGTVFAVTAFLGGSGSSAPAPRRCS